MITSVSVFWCFLKFPRHLAHPCQPTYSCVQCLQHFSSHSRFQSSFGFCESENFLFPKIKRIACVSGVAPTGFNVKRLWCLVFSHASGEWFVKTLCLPISWNSIDDQTSPKSVLWIFLLPELQIFAPRIIGIANQVMNCFATQP